MRQKRRKLIWVSLPPEIFEELRVEAKRTDRKIQWLMRFAWERARERIAMLNRADA